MTRWDTLLEDRYRPGRCECCGGPGRAGTLCAECRATLRQDDTPMTTTTQENTHMSFTPTCAWFALCDRPADGLRSHPVLGSVPICDRCAVRVGEPVTQEERTALQGVQA